MITEAAPMTYYICGTDLLHELPDEQSCRFYKTIKNLKVKENCWKECGVVEVEIKEVKWVTTERFGKK